MATLGRSQTYVKDYVFKKSAGGREQKGAEAGAHDVTLLVLDKINEHKRLLTLKEGRKEGKIERWEKIELQYPVQS